MGQQRFTAGRRVIGVVVLAVVAGVAGIGPASAAGQSVPAPVRQLLSEAHQPTVKHRSTGERHALSLPGEGDDQTFVGFNPGCASGKGKAKPHAFVYSETKLKLDWVLTGSDVSATGTVKTKADRAVALKLPSVRPGEYRLTLAVHSQAALVGDETFDVLPCVVVKTSCRAVTFTNPAGNPMAYVTYSGHKKSQEFDLELAPGASRTVRADYSKVDYDASSDDPDAATSALGRGTVKVKQKCAHGPAQPADNAVQSAGFATCASGGNGVLTLAWSAQPSVTQRRWEVLDSQNQVVRSGAFKGGKDKDVSLTAGVYTYRSYANGVAQPFEEVTVDVFACVQVTPECRAIQVRNPNDAPLVVVVFTTDDETTEVDNDGEETDLPSDGTVTIPWTGPTAWVLAVSASGWFESTSRFVSLASSLSDQGEPPTTTVPQSC